MLIGKQHYISTEGAKRSLLDSNLPFATQFAGIGAGMR
jgi:hypothetical protein